VEIPRVDVDWTDAAVISDPFPLYEEIRAAGRVVWNGVINGWMVPGYDDCVEVLRGRSAREDRFGQVGARYPELTFWFEAPNMIIADRTEHRRLRQPLAEYFTPTYIAGWEPRIREVVDKLLEPLARGREFDLISDFTRIPIVIVAEMMGVPEERHDDFLRWSNTVTGNIGFGRENVETRRRMDQALVELNAYLDEEIERHRREDLDDVMNVMVNRSGWSEPEIRSSVANLLLAGYDTTAKLMAVSVEVLEQHPDQRRLLASGPALIPNAIEEVLRLESPSPVQARYVQHDVEVRGTIVAEGSTMLLLNGSANRDERRFTDPDQFDVHRDQGPHLSFGFGLHFCLGAALARLEGRVALEEILRRWSAWEIDTPPACGAGATSRSDRSERAGMGDPLRHICGS
jgi:cytochrome P450